MRLTPAAIFIASALTLVPSSAAANDWTAEYDKKIKAAQNVGVLGDDIAGDQVNFYTGATSFRVTDVTVPGTAMGISISRSYVVESNHNLAAVKGTVNPYVPEFFSARQRAFGDWDLDVPHISAVMAQTEGWQIDTQTPTKRCEVRNKTNANGYPAVGQPVAALGTRSWTFASVMYWNGYTLHTGGGEQSLLAATLSNPQQPASGGPYEWTTNQNWWVSCIATQNEANGQGFMAYSPNGMKYRFDWISRRNIDSVRDFEPEVMQSNRPSYLFRAEFLMLPTRIEDRFGNYMSYTWSNDAFARLLSVQTYLKDATTPEATVTLTYDANGHVASITDGSRTWTYEYYNGPMVAPDLSTYLYDSLVRVNLPGSGGSWQYIFGGLGEEAPVPLCTIDEQVPKDSQEYYWWCWGGGDQIDPYTMTPTVIHPSGATIQFVFEQRFQYSNSAAHNAAYPISLKQKTITGPGMSEAKWQLSYWPNRDEAKALSQAGTIIQEIFTDELGPAQSLSRRIFSVGAQTETQLLGELEGGIGANGGGSPALTSVTGPWSFTPLDDPNRTTGIVPTFYRATANVYAQAANWTQYIDRVGVNPLLDPWSSQTFSSERRLPLVSRTLTQQGVTFANTTTAFNEYAQPTSVTRSSNGSAGGNFSRTETTTYHHDTTKWVIGQVASVTDVGTGKVVSSTDYDPATVLPWRTYRFGVLQSTMSYNADGTLATVKDGRNNTISLSDWSRGIPRRIDYPTNVFESATVNGLGQITSTTDELGISTSYGYDAMGRLSGITYPTGDTTAWNPLSRGFVAVAASEYGIGAGHWKQTVQTGNGKATTYYDAQWRPVLVVTEDTGNASSQSFVVTRYDSSGRAVFQSYPVASLTTVNETLTGVRTLYDALGRVYQTQQDAEAPLTQLVTTTEYLSGFITRVTNPRGIVSETKYQLFDSPSTEAPVEIVTAKGRPEQQTTTIVRDGFGKPLSVTRSGVAP